MVQAWLLDNDATGDQRLPLQTDPVKYVSLEALAEFGIEYFKFDPEGHETNKEYVEMKAKRGYSYEDTITVSKDTLPNYEVKIKHFYEEHARNINDEWVRIELSKGDLVVLPAGIYHRFTLDENNFCKVKRLFIGEPVWPPYNRPCEEMDERKKYVASFRKISNAA